MSVPRSPVDAAVVAMLRAAMPDGVLVGDGETPEGLPEVPERDLRSPYLIVYPLPGGSFGGSPLTTPEDEAEFMYQVSTVHRARTQCQDGADRARWVLTGRAADGSFRVDLDAHVPTPAHYEAAGLALAVMSRDTAGPPGAAERAGNLWRADDQFSVTVTTIEVPPS